MFEFTIALEESFADEGLADQRISELPLEVATKAVLLNHLHDPDIGFR